MISDEILAALKGIEHMDTLRALGAIQERVGREGLSAAYGELLVEGESGECPRFVARGEFLRTVGQPPPMLVERLIPDKSLILLAGKPKLGKSFLAIQIAEDICEERAVCGEYGVNRPGPVCYLGMEDGMYEIASRLLRRGHRAVAEGETDRPFFVCTERIVLSTVEGIGALRGMVNALPPETGAPSLLVIDTAREALGVRDWNDAAEISERLRPLREFARDICSVLLVAHNRKQAGIDAGDEIAGSGAFASSVDGWISVQRAEKLPTGNRRMWLQIVGRGAMNGDALVEMDTHDLHFRFIPDDERADEERSRAALRRNARYEPALAAIHAQAEGRATSSMLASALDVDVRTAQLLVNDMLAAGLIVEDNSERPTGRGRRAHLYRVAARPAELANNEFLPIDSRYAVAD